MAKPLTFLTRAAVVSLCAALALTGHTASLTEDTPARLAPNNNAAVLRILPAGSELRFITDTSKDDAAAKDRSATWQAIALDGPFTLYVRNGDIDKGLAIKPASPLYLEPDNAAAVVAYAEEGDAITITGLRGRWTQIELQKPLTAYVSTQAGNALITTKSAAPAAATTTTAETVKVTETPAVTASTESATVEVPEPEKLASEAEPDSEPAVPTTTAQPASAARSVTAPPSQINQSATAALNRSQIQGKLVSTRRRFGARRPYDWQINAKFSFRIAYLDFSRMQGTDQLARYEGQQVVVYGLVSPLGDGQYVMLVESIRLQ